MTSNEVTSALTWNELADLYDAAHGGRRARTLPMEKVFAWAEKQTDKFWLHPEEETLHLREGDRE